MARRSLPPKTTLIAPEVDLGPTEERRHHATIERVARPISDEAGRSARPYRAIDTLVAMERRGTITASMRHAAEDFRARFVAAQLDPLHALDYSRLRDGERGRGNRAAPAALRAESARQDVWRAIVALGGPGSPGGSCVWHVVGWECSIKEWALEQGWNGRQISQEAASGILVAALGALEAHYRRAGAL